MEVFQPLQFNDCAQQDYFSKGETKMSDDKQVQSTEQELESINLEIATRENDGDLEWLTNAIAPELAFRRAGGAVVGRAKFLEDVEDPERPTDRETDPESLKVEIYGNRAVVSCIVSMTVKNKENEDETKKYHNLRLFARVQVEKDNTKVWEWKLLGWANEEVVEAVKDGTKVWNYKSRL
jgi:hypothetical protein